MNLSDKKVLLSCGTQCCVGHSFFLRALVGYDLLTCTCVLQIIVAGAGLGGLTHVISLLHLCKQRGIAPPSIRIYERDAHLNARAQQGYSMSIRADARGG